MPIYLYRCSSCGAEVEKIQSYSADAPDCAAGPIACFGSPMVRVPATSNMAIGKGKKGSFVGEAIKRVKARGL